jgi:hypothetical protein
LDSAVLHERACSDPLPAPDRGGERRLSVPAPAATLLRLQREAGNRTVGRLLRRDSQRRLARADAGTAPAAAPSFTIPMETAALEVRSYGPTLFTAELRDYRNAFVAYTNNCAAAAFETFRKLTDKALHSPKGRQPGFRTYDRTNPRWGGSGAVDEEQTDINWNPTKVAETVAYIKSAIDRGLPLFVGVNEGGGGQEIGSTGRPINEGVTDHFLIIAGYTAEYVPSDPGGWRVVRFAAIDNATTHSWLSFPTFEVTPTSIRKPAPSERRDQASDFEYQLTQVRVYADDVEQAKTASAWWD